jgi:2-hydroxy-6-oxonona-2,4-dienedioate hydrolase
MQLPALTLHKRLFTALAVIAFSTVAIGAPFYLRYRSEIRAAYKRISAGSKLAETPCGLIEYADIGSGIPIFVVHGAGGGFDQGLDFAHPLAVSGFRVIAVSRFGYLRTPLPKDASPEAQADAYASLLDHLAIRSTAILGVSAGASSAMQFALRHLDRCNALMLFVPAVYKPRPPENAGPRRWTGTDFMFNTALKSDFLFWLATKTARRVLLQTILATPPDVVDQANDEDQARVFQILDHILPVSERQQGLLNDAAVISRLPRYPLEQIAVPTLVSSVVDDLFMTYERARYTAEHIPGARFFGYKTGGHVWVGHDQEILSLMADFMRRHV